MKSVDDYKKKTNKQKRFMSCIFRCVFLGIVLWMVFHKHYREIFINISNMGIGSLIFIILSGVAYQLIGSYAFYLLAGKNNPQFTMKQSAEATYLGIFGTVAAFSLGSVPIRTYYLHTHNIDAGKAVGLINADYILHKSAVLIYNTVLLLFTGRSVLNQRENMVKYIFGGYVICLFVIGILLLIGFSKRTANCLRDLVMLLPDRKKWKTIKEKTRYHLETMYSGSKEIKDNRKNILLIIFFHCIKLLIMYGIPFVCLRGMMDSEISFFEIQTLVALTNLISNAIPNVSGIGGTELAFFLVFEGFLDRASVSSVLVLYRLATYFFPFLISIVVFNKVERHRREMH